jgi:hypothetical protein
MQKLAPDLAFSTAHWIDMSGDSAMASDGQAVSAAVVPRVASAGWPRVCKLAARATSNTAAAVNGLASHTTLDGQRGGAGTVSAGRLIISASQASFAVEVEHRAIARRLGCTLATYAQDATRR